MKHLLFFFILLCLGNLLSAQGVYTIKADSVKLTGCDSSELIIENHTQNIPGFLFNTGNGRTIFKRGLLKINDSLYLIGGDTLKVRSRWLANSGLSIPDSAVIFGQAVGASGNPARLLHPTEIPFGGYSLAYIDSLNNSAVKSRIVHFGADAAGNYVPIDIFSNGNGGMTAGSNAAYFISLTPVNYGKGYLTGYAPNDTITMDKWTLGYAVEENNEGGLGEPDAVLNFGYNTNANGGRRSSKDAAWRFGFETNYLGQVGGVSLDQEFHLPEITTFNGKNYRINSYYVNKTYGVTRNEAYIDDFQYFASSDTLVYPGHQYFDLSSGADVIGTAPTLTLYGDGNHAHHTNQIAMQDQSTGNVAYFRQRGTGLYAGYNDQPGISISSESNVSLNANFNTNTVRGVTQIGIYPSWIGYDTSAILSVYSTHKGFLPPAMTTTQQNAISFPATGLHIANNDSGSIWSQYDGSQWHLYATRDWVRGQIESLAQNPGSPSSLAVNGTITTQKLQIRPSRWSDFVFAGDYQLPSLGSVETYIRQNKHLPGIPSATLVETNGIDVGENQALLLRKVEELTLYIIRQNKELQQQKEKIEELQRKNNVIMEVNALSQQVAELKKFITAKTEK